MNRSYLEFLCDSLCNLTPGAQWRIDGREYSGIVWLEKPIYEGGQKKPTKAEVEAEVARLQKEWEDTEYQRLRAKEYPDVKEYLDGLVKGDTEQMQAYIDACLAVKAKYPKPEVNE
jgi:sigma54-dependent transcription regulator